MNLTGKEQLNITGVVFRYTSPFFVGVGALMFWLRGATEGDNALALTVVGGSMLLMALLFFALGTVFKNMAEKMEN